VNGLAWHLVGQAPPSLNPEDAPTNGPDGG